MYCVEPNRPGVYALSHVEMGVLLVGSSSRCMYSRLVSHMHALRHGRHSSRRLQAIYNAEPDKIVQEVLEYCTNGSVKSRERYWANLMGVT